MTSHSDTNQSNQDNNLQIPKFQIQIPTRKKFRDEERKKHGKMCDMTFSELLYTQALIISPSLSLVYVCVCVCVTAVSRAGHLAWEHQ